MKHTKPQKKIHSDAVDRGQDFQSCNLCNNHLHHDLSVVHGSDGFATPQVNLRSLEESALKVTSFLEHLSGTDIGRMVPSSSGSKGTYMW